MRQREECEKEKELRSSDPEPLASEEEQGWQCSSAKRRKKRRKRIKERRDKKGREDGTVKVR